MARKDREPLIRKSYRSGWWNDRDFKRLYGDDAKLMSKAKRAYVEQQGLVRARYYPPSDAFVRAGANERREPVRLYELSYSNRWTTVPTNDWVYKHDRYTVRLDEIEPQEVLALIQQLEQAEQRDKDWEEALARAEVQAAVEGRDVPATTEPTAAGQRQPIPDDVKIFVWRRDGGRCVRCGSQENLEFDHVIPIAMGGSSTARNLQILCESCNREKGGRLVPGVDL